MRSLAQTTVDEFGRSLRQVFGVRRLQEEDGGLCNDNISAMRHVVLYDAMKMEHQLMSESILAFA